ncbi:hypothetical protein IB238_05025 [Rhizobium sp. ARZ01]|uniref:hypothetical protein n=1 Tax=Rhizobium sp. ARZ01 TaxID=2769313 RepID=UPI001784A4EE|nr:hypothetical protein [Rhizobium sp. ARZ01]MBD9371999.1 hypothetical protein [Rhizobium sp. ARZ01]
MRAQKILPRCLLLLLCAAFPAMADESAFLQSLAGKWSGKGTVITRIGRPAINVNCRLVSTADDTSVEMKATCRGLLVVSRTISAALDVNAGRYIGIYIGPTGRRSTLSGSRQGDSINLAVRWSRLVNGDRSAQMMIQKIGNNGLRLRTVDKDLSTGKDIATSDIVLQRS